MPNLTDGLNEEQSRAVISESKRILMLAGAGTGKTRTLTHRLAHLNLNCRVGASSIVAITFTRAAAKEMKDRLIPLIGKREVRNLTCSTFHALAVRILQDWGQRIGLNRRFSIYDQEDREEILKSIIAKYGYFTTVNKVLRLKNKNPMSEESAAWDEYQWQLKRFNAVDLDSLIRKVNWLFIRHPDVAAYYRNQWKYMFVDEFQDTDDEQMLLLERINPENLFVIGDWRQSIYGWRGARVEHILDFTRSYPDAELIELNRNYRSTIPIVESANNLISHSVIRLGEGLVTERQGVDIKIVEMHDVEHETNGILAVIKNKQEDKPYSDFAVLARTNAQIEGVYRKLKAEGIPCNILSSSDDPLKKPDIKSLISYLDAIVNPNDDTNFKRVLRFPEPVMTDLQWQQVEQVAIDQSVSIREAMKLSDEPKIKEFIDRFDLLVDLVRNIDTIHRAFTFLSEAPFLGLEARYLERSLHNRMEDLQAAKQYIYYWQERQLNMGEDLSPQAFLKWLRIRDIQEKLLEERDSVKLMTVHGSKGLEFETVFLIGMNDGVFPSQNSSDYEEERRLAYVAVTRAKRNLIITSPRNYVSAWGKEQVMQPSRFIQEMMERSNESAQ